MAGAGDLARSAREIGEGGRDALDALSGVAPAGGKASGLVAFFDKTDNVLALAVCLAALFGLYRLLRAEQIIPAPRRTSGGLLDNALARRLALRVIVFAVMTAIGLALAMSRLTGFLDRLKGFF